MTRQILVDTTRPANGDVVTYVTVQDDDKGLIRTIPIQFTLFGNQVDAIAGIAYKYDISSIKIDLHGVGLGLFDYFVVVVGEENTNRKTGEVTLPTKPKAERDVFTEAQNNAIKFAETISEVLNEYVKFAKKGSI